MTLELRLFAVWKPLSDEDKCPERLKEAETNYLGAIEPSAVGFGSSNTWIPADLQEKNLWGLRWKAFWSLLGIICALVVGAAIVG